MKVLSFYNHGSYFADLSRIRHELFFWSQWGKPQWWAPKKESPPTNVHFVDNLKHIEYDVALISEAKQIEILKASGIDVPIIAVCGGEAPATAYNQDCVAIVANCARNLEKCTPPNKRLIYHSYDPDEYAGYTGDIECAVTLAGAVGRRTELRMDMTRQAVAGWPHLFVGVDNEGVPNAMGHVRHDTAKALLRNFRVYVYTPTPVCGMSMATGEAFMTGMPLAVTDFGDWKQYIQNGVNGFVSDDITELRRFIALCMSSQSYAKDVGSKGRDVARAVFHIHEFVALWTDLINKVGSGEITKEET